jgi:hypothetical protein
MTPAKGWPETLIASSIKSGRQYKRENGPARLHRPDRDVPPRRGHRAQGPSVIFADEAQDLNRMQLSLVRKWGERANYFIVAGDDDQTIYSFTGATPEAFLDPDIPDDHKIILKQSYRVPRAVHRLAEELIRRSPGARRRSTCRGRRTARLDRLSRDTYKRRSIAILKRRDGAPRAGQDGDVPGVLLVHAEALVQVLRKQRHPVPQPVPEDQRLLEPAADRQARFDANRILSLLVGHPDFGEGHRPWTMGDVALWANGSRRRASCATA